jgi:thiol-disulfide isomerase/thioredoxin
MILFPDSAFSQGQAIWVPVEVVQDSFPHKEFRDEVLLPNALYSLKESWDSSYRNGAGIVPEGMFVIQAGRQMGFWKKEYAALVTADSLGGLIGRDAKTGQRMMGIDGNGNRVFEPQEVFPMRENGLHLVHWQLKTPEGKTFWDLDLEIQYTPGRDAGLSIRTLTLGEVLLPLEDTLLREVISLGLLEPCFYLPDSAPSGRLKTTRYVLGEPFPFGRHYYMLDQLDIPNKRIRLTKFPPDHRPLGYKEGYFLNMDSLQTLLQNYYQILKNVPVVAWNPDRYKLFYFWGTWCGPCMEKLPHSTAL